MKRKSGIVQPDREAIEAQLPKARKRLDQFPQGWLWLEQVGRCLRWLGDPEAEAYFHQAAANYPLRAKDPVDHTHLGNLCRLAGEVEKAQRHWPAEVSCSSEGCPGALCVFSAMVGRRVPERQLVGSSSSGSLIDLAS